MSQTQKKVEEQDDGTWTCIFVIIRAKVKTRTELLIAWMNVCVLFSIVLWWKTELNMNILRPSLDWESYWSSHWQWVVVIFKWNATTIIHDNEMKKYYWSAKCKLKISTQFCFLFTVITIIRTKSPYFRLKRPLSVRVSASAQLRNSLLTFTVNHSTGFIWMCSSWKLPEGGAPQLSPQNRSCSVLKKMTHSND